MSNNSSRLLNRLSKFDLSYLDYRDNDDAPLPNKNKDLLDLDTDTYISRDNIYRGTVFDFPGNLSQQLLSQLRPMGNHINLSNIEETIQQLEQAIERLKKKTQKNKGTRYKHAVSALQELADMQDLLYSYRVALFTG